ncbi:MAG: 16S rRNA (cytidine(1402)-2'-O)-methyltransferase [Acetobacteraceae bacterium]|nr:16S rRNA (cytidine(1402)-2'-O)-methyltransferase [Acetobacteraceae bacterium]
MSASSLPSPDPKRSGGLVLVSTPIGNLGDMTSRAIAELRAADLVLCEDTRTSARLLTAFDIRARTQALHDHNEEERIPGLLAQLREGRRIAVISDAGMPVVSDPGFRLVRAAIAEGLHVDALPGANAATLALVLSGLPPLPFLFQGFLPPKQAARRAALERLRAIEQAGLSATTIWYESPHRLAETLADMADILGPRPAAVARELTKKFEEVRRATLSELAAHYAVAEARGEIALVVGPPPEQSGEVLDIDAMLRAAMRQNSLKDAVAAVAQASGQNRKSVYARALALAAED